MNKTNQDPDWLRIPHHDLSAVISAYRNWIADQERLGFYPGSVAIIATGDPSKPWAVEVSRRLFEKSFSEVW